LFDICEGTKYTYIENTLSLVLFTDAVTYTKSVSNSIWAIFSCVVELPPIVRCSFENIIFHSLWAGDDVDFNLFLKKYNNELDEIISNGITINNTRYNIRILGFIADNPARSKVLNCMQFNGYYGCLMCLHPTRRNSKNSAQIYPLINKIELRTDKLYMEQVTLSVETGGCVYGIKGATYMSKWIDIPSCVLLDYMHLCLIGSFKCMINNLFDSKNKFESYYLGKI